MEIRNAMDGFLYQDSDLSSCDPALWKLVSEKKGDATLIEALGFPWSIARQIKSNAIVFCSEDATLGIGAGQMSRLDSVELAIAKAAKAQLSLKASLVASDAFFPFRDGIDALAKAGAKAVIQPGGSIRDQEVLEAANEHGLIMIFTGMRHFLH